MTAEDARRAAVTVSTCLNLAELASAVVLAGEDRLDTTVDWVAVMERPVENFVTPGDLILTTCIGCTEEMLETFVVQSAEAGAAAICVTVGEGAPIATVPDHFVSAAQELGVVLATVPWAVRFSDVSRAVIETLYAPHRSGGATRATGDLPFEFTQALLESGGVVSVAHALEGAVDDSAPVVILDPALAVIGEGPTATEWIARGTLHAAVAVLKDTVDDVMVSEATNAAIHAEAEGALIVAAPARGQGKILGWVMLVLPGPCDTTVADAAVRHAATAAAIELLRQEAAEEFGSRARAQFFWGLSAGEFSSPQELAARSALLGLPLNARFKVVAGLAASDDEQGASSTRLARDIARGLRLRLRHPASIATHRESEILLCLEQRDSDVDPLLDDPVLQAFSQRVTWGWRTGCMAFRNCRTP
jgi:PucR family transcriptional regulator, purine catabolism regulatory protein